MTLQVSLIEMLVRGIPESLILVLAMYAFSGYKAKMKPFLLSSCLLFVAMTLIRFLPINYGVHIVPNILLLVAFSVKFMGIPTLKAIKSSLFVVISLFGIEIANYAVLFLIYGSQDRMEEILSDPLDKALICIPSTIVWAIVIYIFYVVRAKTELETVKDGEAGE